MLKSLICLYLPSPNSPALFKKTQQKCNKSILVQSLTDRYLNKYNTYNKQLYLHVSSFIIFTDTSKSLLFSSSQTPMAFTASVTKQLGDLLQEQQEPFVLEIYLIDKGYRKNVLLSKKSTSNRYFKRASWSEVHLRRKFLSSCSSTVKALLDILKVKRGGGSQKTAENKGQHKLGNLLTEVEVRAFFSHCSYFKQNLYTKKNNRRLINIQRSRRFQKTEHNSVLFQYLKQHYLMKVPQFISVSLSSRKPFIIFKRRLGLKKSLPDTHTLTPLSTESLPG